MAKGAISIQPSVQEKHKPDNRTPHDMLDEDREALVLFLVHDLEGPLASMQTMLRLLENTHFDHRKRTHRNLLASSKVALERAERIIEDLLAVGKMENGQLSVELHQLDLAELIHNSLRLVSASAQENEINMQIVLPNNVISVRADHNLLLRVLDNLLFNAIRHTPPKGTITLNAREHGDQVEISICNTGEEFQDINLIDLFGKFKQVRHRKLGKQRGVGLGLYFCRLALETMQGSIKAYRTEEGYTCFSFSVGKGGHNQ